MAEDQVTMSEIAGQIGVTLSAVSNWRRRHQSFPVAEKTSGKELFTVTRVADWLDHRKIARKDLKPNELPGTTYGSRFRKAMRIANGADDLDLANIWKELFKLRGTSDVAVFADLVLGLLYLATCEDRHWADIVTADRRTRPSLVQRVAFKRIPVLYDRYRIHDEFSADMGHETQLADIVDLVDRIRQSGRSAEAFEFLLGEFTAAEGRRGAEVYTPPAIVRLLVELVAPEPGDRVFDPSCGSGGFLIGAATYLAAHGGHTSDTSFVGHALSQRSASLARMNLELRGAPAEVDAHADKIFKGDGRLIANKRYDVILSNPPFDMKGPRLASAPELHGRYGFVPRNLTSFAWLQYVASALADGGRAAVVMSGGTLFRRHAEEHVRARMVDDRIVEAIIALPPQMFTSTGIPVSVWLLSNAAVRCRNEVLLIDASDLGYMISRTQRDLSDVDRRRIVDTITTWRGSEGYKDVRGFSASVSVRHLRDQGYVLTPARYVGTSVSPETRKPLRELRGELTDLARRAAEVDEAADRQLARIQAWIR